MEKENGKLTLVAATYLKKLFPEAKGAPKATLMPAFNKLLWFFLCGALLNDGDIHCHRRTSDKDLYFISWHNCALLLAVKKVDIMNDLLEEPIFLASHVSFVDFETGGKITQENIRRSEESFLDEFAAYLEKRTWKEILEMGNDCLLDYKDPKKKFRLKLGNFTESATSISASLNGRFFELYFLQKAESS